MREMPDASVEYFGYAITSGGSASLDKFGLTTELCKKVAAVIF
jgi:hypothetical protein